jgi:hypothetical protein
MATFIELIEENGKLDRGPGNYYVHVQYVAIRQVENRIPTDCSMLTKKDGGCPQTQHTLRCINES